ncbi:hypothetical protein [Flavobacterium sp. UGB4466]|uniref:hypothetical protein n=1 Tax=Flavobacterium sp. UGB4466 TaxID=2730889 RepID=UPI00192B8179|nr:hypothetical protein [Flavobacterium sp. UGB4466]
MAFGISGVKYKNAKSTTFGMFEVAYRYNIRGKFKAGGDLSYLRTEDKFEKSKTFGAFVELGFGYKGIATAGLNYKF